MLVNWSIAQNKSEGKNPPYLLIFTKHLHVYSVDAEIDDRSQLFIYFSK